MVSAKYKYFNFKKNILLLVSTTIILFFAFIALFAYIIAPDNSPNANTILPEIANKKPGYTVTLLPIANEAIAKHTSKVLTFFMGSPKPVSFIPIHPKFVITKDSIYCKKMVDDGIYIPLILPIKKVYKHEINVHNYHLGTDKFGRDMLSRLIIGTRVSLSVGIIAVILSLTIGIFLGSVAGYYQGRTDAIIMWLVNIVWSIPTLLLVFAITLILGKGFWQVFIAVGLTMWINVARLVRGQVLAIKQQEYIEAARVLGYNNARIIINHILPNIIGPILVMAASNFAAAIVIEAGLSFLGVGVQPPQPSWGLMMKENYNFIITNNPFLALAPGLCIMLLVLAFNLLGNALRDRFDVK